MSIDALVGAGFVMAPFLFGFTGGDLAYFLAIGVTILAVVGLHRDDEEELIAQPSK